MRSVPAPGHTLGAAHIRDLLQLMQEIQRKAGNRIRRFPPKQDNTMDTVEQKKEQAFSLIIQSGEIMLQSGAEIFRVEETMKHMAKSLHIYSLETYIIANGIFATAEGDWHLLRAQIKHVRTGDTDLGKIDAVNTLSRDLEAGLCTMQEAQERLETIRRMGDYPVPLLLLSYAVGSGCFCYILGGSGADAFAATFVGLLLGIFFMLLRNWNGSKALKSIFGSILVTFLSITLCKYGFGTDPNHMIIGGLMPMIPGVSFSSSIRDFVENDYVSGLIRLMDVLLTVVSMAVGVTIVWQLIRIV